MGLRKPPSRFRCAGCGNCCRGEGFVRITAQEAREIAGFLGIPHDRFLAEYTRKPEIERHAAAGDLWLVDRADGCNDCVFLQEARCRINPVKPRQCRDFPMRWRTADVLDYCAGLKDPE